MSEKLVLPEYIRNELQSYFLRKFGASDVSFSVNYGSKNGDSYSSDIYRVTVDVLNGSAKRSSSDIHPSQYILKMSPTVEIRRQMFKTTKQFSQEYYMYSVVLPALETFQLKYLPKEDIFDYYPKMISGSLKPGHEYIFLEDMAARGFINFHRPIPLNFDQCATVFKSLAKLHATSFAYKDQHPEKFAKLVQPLHENVFSRPIDKDFAFFLVQKIDCAAETLGDEDHDVRERVQEFKDLFVDAMVECVEEKEHAAIIHGDCWVSNLLIRQTEAKSDLDIAFIDWQIARYGTPVIDLAYFTFCCTNSQVRTQLNTLLEIYYKTLSDRMEALKSDPDNVFSYSKFQQHVKKYMKFGFGMALMSLHAITCAPDEMPDVVSYLDKGDYKKMDEVTESLTKRTAYRQRMADVCRDLVKYGYI